MGRLVGVWRVWVRRLAYDGPQGDLMLAVSATVASGSVPPIFSGGPSE